MANIPGYKEKVYLGVSGTTFKVHEIACYKGDNLLNKRTEILGTCRHRNKYKLKNCDSKD